MEPAVTVIPGYNFWAFNRVIVGNPPLPLVRCAEQYRGPPGGFLPTCTCTAATASPPVAAHHSGQHASHTTNQPATDTAHIGVPTPCCSIGPVPFTNTHQGSTPCLRYQTPSPCQPTTVQQVPYTHAGALAVPACGTALKDIHGHTAPGRCCLRDAYQQLQHCPDAKHPQLAHTVYPLSQTPR